MEDFGFEEDGDQFDDDLVKAIQNSLKENFKTPAPNVMDDQTSKEPVNSSPPDTNIVVHDGQNKETPVSKLQPLQKMRKKSSYLKNPQYSKPHKHTSYPETSFRKTGGSESTNP